MLDEEAPLTALSSYSSSVSEDGDGGVLSRDRLVIRLLKKPPAFSGGLMKPNPLSAVSEAGLGDAGGLGGRGEAGKLGPRTSGAESFKLY